jgi:hypothetical protein
VTTAAPILLIGAFVVLAALIVYVAWRSQKKRREAFFRLCARLGLTYSIDDPFDTPSLPFAVFRLGNDRCAENMMYGEVGRMRVRLFDYYYQVRHRNPKGPDTTSRWLSQK